MLKKIEFKSFLKILIIVMIVAITIITSKYIGLLEIIFKVINSLSPVFFAIAISFINEPLINKLSNHLKRKIAVIIIYILEVILISLIIILILPSLIEQLKKFFLELPSVYEAITTRFDQFKFNLNIEKTISTYSKEILSTLSNIITFVFNIGIAYVGAFFLSFDYLTFKSKVKDFLLKRKKDKVVIYIQNFIPFIYKYTYCILIDMLVLWIITGVSFLLAGLEYPFMFGAIIAIFDLIPYLGPIIGGAPAVIVSLTISFKFAIFILIIIILAQFIENNITRPYIMKNAIQLHPIEGLIGLAIGGSLFGFLGLILSPIYITGIKIYFNLRKEEKI